MGKYCGYNGVVQQMLEKQMNDMSEGTIIAKDESFSNAEYSGDWKYHGDKGPTISSDYDSLFKMAGDKLKLDWRLVAAHCYCESGFNPNAVSSVGCCGLWQIKREFWGLWAPDGKSEDKWLTDPEVETYGYINIMTDHLAKHANASTMNDKIMLALQHYHDGHAYGTEWHYNTKRSTGESKNYVRKILKTYAKYGGSVTPIPI